MRLLRVGVLAIGLTVAAQPAFLLGLLLAGAKHAPKLRQSHEPFVANPRFCLPEVAFIGDECAVQPTDC